MNRFFKRKKEAIIKQFEKNVNITQDILKKLDTLFTDFEKELLANKKDMFLAVLIALEESGLWGI